MTLAKQFRYAWYVLVHPFKGFWDIKHEKKGGIRLSLCLLLALLVSTLLKESLSGYLFNMNYGENINLLKIILSVLMPVMFWSVSNWCLTTLVDGEGSFYDIVVVMGYAMLPLICSNLLTTALSRFVTLDEGMVVTFFQGVGILWSVCLLLVGTQVIHQFTLFKTILTTILTIVGIMAVVFILLLCYNMVQSFISFVESVVKEIIYRI